MPIPIVDGHNDLLLRLWGGDEPRDVELSRAAESGFAAGFFAVYVPSPRIEEPRTVPYSISLAEPLDRDEAARIAQEATRVLFELERERRLRVARGIDELLGDTVGAILHFEGADPLASDLSDLDVWYERGLRSVGVVWSRPNAFGEGVPFRFPATPDTGPGLTEAGRELVRACNRLGILVDCSHLNRAGFFDVARTSAVPLVATHSNPWSLCQSTRNLQDDQLDAIAASGGVVGVNFGVAYLREDGRVDPDTPLAEIVRHAEYLAERMGVDHVALGSDFEGATMPAELGGIAGLPRLVDAFRAAGWDEPSLRKLCHESWLRVLRETWR
jgi:membrane dipeptidase